ncbi:hypothetical protein [Halalkalibacter okhensis]|uniref:Uncharacterized protein n=1 Tax=Halalkalibacter okhensis TaxID=333138 RepID=A0A0B0ILA8_9BACI|nr:hypothetical protein [Halalkalibacter okhensis]KHF41682.1 hypothetical protein LQ50_02995 [Halalkalibacter okhensis]
MFVLLILTVFIISIGLILLILKQLKKSILLFIVTLVIVILYFGGWWVFVQNHHFVRSTDLAKENIGDVSLLDPINESLMKGYGEYTEHENIYYERSFHFETGSIGTNSKNEIIYIRAIDPRVKTTSGLKIGDLKQEISEWYGDNYFEQREMGRGDSINYIDRQYNIQLQFWLIDDRITEIVLKKVR